MFFVCHTTLNKVYLILSYLFVFGVSQSSHMTLRWRPNGHDGVSNHQPHHCLLNRLVRRRSKKTLKLRVTGLCAGNSPVTGEFPAQMASNAENVFIRLRHHELTLAYFCKLIWYSMIPCHLSGPGDLIQNDRRVWRNLAGLRVLVAYIGFDSGCL